MSENLTSFLSTISSIIISTIFLSKPGNFKRSFKFLPTLLLVSSLEDPGRPESTLDRFAFTVGFGFGTLVTVWVGLRCTTELGLGL